MYDANKEQLVQSTAAAHDAGQILVVNAWAILRVVAKLQLQLLQLLVGWEHVVHCTGVFTV
jgi:hypothetical protein